MDAAIVLAMNETVRDYGAVSAIAQFLSSFWVPVLAGIILVPIFLKQRRYAVIVSVLLASGATDLVTSRVLKPTFARERPCRELDGLSLPNPCGVGKSFPSGHASNSFAVAVSAAPAMAPYGWYVLLPLAASVASSRVFLGVHYPSDVLVGALFGALVGGLAWQLRRRWEARSGTGSG